MRQESTLSRALLSVNSTIYRGHARIEKLEGGLNTGGGEHEGLREAEVAEIESLWRSAADDCR